MDDTIVVIDPSQAGNKRKLESPAVQQDEKRAKVSPSLLTSTTAVAADKKTRLDAAPKNIHFGKYQDVLYGTYCNEHLKYMQSLEKHYIVHKDVLEKGTFDTAKRGQIISWLAQTSTALKIQTNVFYRCVHLMDLYTAKGPIDGPIDRRYSSIAIACLILALKVAHIKKVHVRKVLLNFPSTRREEFLQLERDILKALDFNLTAPTPFDYLDRFLCAVPKTPFLEEQGQEVRKLTEQFLLTWTLQKANVFPASHIAAAAVRVGTSLANKTVSPERKINVRDEDLILWTNVSIEETHPILQTLLL